MDRNLRISAGFFLVALALACWSVTAHGSEPDRLIGKGFRATSMTKDGNPVPAVDGQRLHAKFVEERRMSLVRWHSGCNFFGARARITSGRIATGRIDQTQVGCSEQLLGQDRRFVRFFRKDPRWHLAGQRLTLSAGRTVIELRRAPPG